MADGMPGLTGKQATDAALSLFREYFGDNVDGLMLEGLEALTVEHQWKVVLGFNGTRMRRLRPDATAAKMSFVPIRETRTFYLRADDGAFVRMV